MKSAAFVESLLGTYDDKGLEVYGEYSYDIPAEDDDVTTISWNLKSVEDSPGLEVWECKDIIYPLFFVSPYHGIVLSSGAFDIVNRSKVIVHDLMEGHLKREGIQRVLKKIGKLPGKRGVCDQLRGAHNTVESWIGGMKLVECVTRTKTLINRAAEIHPKIVDIVLQEIYSKE